jgi:hypothetical protein
MPARPAVFIAYLRVSTAKQGAKGLGIEAQRAAVETFARQEGATIAAEYVEVETGKGHDALGSSVDAPVDARDLLTVPATIGCGHLSGLEMRLCQMPRAGMDIRRPGADQKSER